MCHDEIVQLPEHVRRIIEERAGAMGFKRMERAAAELSAAYREERAPRLSDDERTAAYLAMRMPATYAAAVTALREVPHINSVLDIGGGTGAASLAARERFPHASLTIVERDRAFAEAAREWLPDAETILGDARGKLPERDLVIASYSLGEMGEGVATRLWNAARVALVVVEPGTPAGFSRIRHEVRDELLALGAHMVAPCPGEAECPIAAPDWCHFAARVERSSIHRRIKHAELGYEDEKFSYVVLAREPQAPAQSRIIRRPQQKPGLIVLETCTPAGLRTEHVKKRDREQYRAARRAGWGDRWGTVS